MNENPNDDQDSTNDLPNVPKPRGLPIPPGGGLPFGAPKKPEPAEGDFFNEVFDSREEESAIQKIQGKSETFNYTSKYSEIESRIKKRYIDLRNEYPAGGWKAFQVIDLAILMDAPADFFLRFEDDVYKAIGYVQAQLAEKGLAEDIGAAQNNKLDDDLHDKAFRSIQSMATTFLEKTRYKGIERTIMIYLIACDLIGYSRIEPLWQDRSIDEILCNGPNDTQIEVEGQLLKIPSVQFRDTAHIQLMLEKIFGSTGKTLSRTTPLLNGRMYDNSRIFAVHTAVAPAGPNVSIRRHPEKYWTPMELIKYGSGSEEMFTELGNLIHKGCSYIVIGGTSSGKTSLLNATSGFFDPKQRLVSLEDDLELKLHPGKLLAAPMECRAPNPNNDDDKGITMRDLVKASLRMRPDGIVIGEVRDGAMYDLCQALNTGHWGCSTVHANSPEDGIYRMQSLVTQAELLTGDAALPLIAAAFDFIIMQEHFPQDGSRKITSITEINPYPEVGDDGHLKLGLNKLWEFNPDDRQDDDKVTGEWVKVGELSEIRKRRRHLNLSRNLTWAELEEICKIELKND